MTEIRVRAAARPGAGPGLAQAPGRDRLAAAGGDRADPGRHLDRAPAVARHARRSSSPASSRRPSRRSSWPCEIVAGRGSRPPPRSSSGQPRSSSRRSSSSPSRSSRTCPRPSPPRETGSPRSRPSSRPCPSRPRSGLAIDNATQGIQAWVSASVSDIVTKVADVATIAILATFLTFFFMMDGDKAWVWVMSSVNTWRRETIATSGHVALERVGGYLRGTAAIAALDRGRRRPLPGHPRGPARCATGGHRLLRAVHPVPRAPRDVDHPDPRGAGHRAGPRPRSSWRS